MQWISDCLDQQAALRPDEVYYRFLLDGEDDEAYLTYADIDRRSRAVAAVLQARGLAGQNVLILCPPGIDYVVAMLGCMRSGAIAVPSYPPDPSRLERTLPRLQTIVVDSKAAAILTVEFIEQAASMFLEQLPALTHCQWLVVDTLAQSMADEFRPWTPTPDQTSFLQYTSGSTSAPRGVMVTWGNINDNMEHIGARLGKANKDEPSVGVFWLPPFHDMGLFASILCPLYVDARSVAMSPISFLQRPYRWLKALSKYRGTISAAPNFAYDLSIRKTTLEQRETLDLSSWRYCFNGAEPVRADTLERFYDYFAPAGLRRSTVHPVYGLAEATLFVSGDTAEIEPRIVHMDPQDLLEHRVTPVTSSVPHSQRLVGCGAPLQDRVFIVDPRTHKRVQPGQVGEVWLTGASVAAGYYGKPELSREFFGARIVGDEIDRAFLRTGDMGFIYNDELFITGRRKDLIIIAGRNHYPQDVEKTVERSSPWLRPGSGAAFGVDVEGQERLTVIHEWQRPLSANERGDIERGIVSAVAAEHQLQVHAVRLIKPGTLPRTSSGKVQRHAARAQFLANSLVTEEA